MENNFSEEKINIGSQLGETVFCSSCGKSGTSDLFIALQNDKGEPLYLCFECKIKLNIEFENQTQNPKIFPAILLGILGGLLGGLVWYYFTIFSEIEIGYISIGLGYLVGLGVHFGSGKKRGKKLQIISAVIALLAIILTESYILEFFANQYLQQNPSEFPDFLPGEKIYISIFNPAFWTSIASPIGLIIYGVGIYFAYMFCKPKKI